MDTGIIRIVVFYLGLLFGCLMLIIVIVAALKGKKIEIGNAALGALGVVLLGMSIWTTIKIELPGGTVLELSQALQENEVTVAEIRAGNEEIAGQVRRIEETLNQIEPSAAQRPDYLSLRSSLAEIKNSNSLIGRKTQALDTNIVVAREGLDKLKKSARLVPDKTK